MVKTAIITILILGNSQTAGNMGMLLETYYRDHGIQVHREAASGKGVNYFLSATRPINKGTFTNNNIDFSDEVLMFSRQRNRIKDFLKMGVDYIIFASLGGNDAYSGCCNTILNKRKMINKYRKLFKQLCSYNTVVIFNGSPPANIKKWPKFDKRRKILDQIQDEAAIGTCVIRNSVRSLKIPSDEDGYHYNDSAKLYVEYLLKLSGMNLPILEK